MIQKYSDSAANERTFLAWIRTGIAVIAFGFVVEKFDLFIIVLASTVSAEAASRMWVDRLTKPFGQYDGIALVVVGVGVIFVAALRFFRTAKLIVTLSRAPRSTRGWSWHSLAAVKGKSSAVGATRAGKLNKERAEPASMTEERKECRARRPG
jgi:putative membrane protein